MVAELKAQVRWLSAPDADQRLRRVYALLLKERSEESPQPTIEQLLLRGLKGDNHDGTK